MNITDRAAIVLQQIDARIAAIAGNWPDESRALRCLKTAITGMLKERAELLRSDWEADGIDSALTTLLDQWEARP